MRSPLCQMDQNNLARVFGPTVVGHGMSEPTPSTIMRDTNTQPKVRRQQKAHLKRFFLFFFLYIKTLKYLLLLQVMSRLLSLPESYWKSVLTDPVPSTTIASAAYNQDAGHGLVMSLL